MKGKRNKTKRNVKEIEDPQKITNKTSRSEMVYVTLKRVSPRFKGKRDVLNVSPTSVSKKNINSNKLKNSAKTLHVHQFKETSKTSRSRNGNFKKSCEKNLKISIKKTSIRNSTIIDKNSSNEPACNTLSKKINDCAEIIQEKNIETLDNISVLNSKSRNKLKKRNCIVPDVKKKNKNSSILCDIATASFITPTSFTKSRIKKTEGSEAISTPLNKKVSLKLNHLLCKKMTVSKKGLSLKGSVKRKRCAADTLQEKSEGYEDDIYENKYFNKFKENLFMDDDSDTSEMNIATPKCVFLCTPRMPKKTPRFKDCYNPEELMKARKLAEEYIHHRNERKLKDTLNLENSLQERNQNYD